ncbi:thiamine-phosphate kinase [Geobacter sp. AOG1]|uniref:thiamine-phosphate kinase n=1 Tax=Geobacter sp. AOG1 TaxID=1566346 RepID=UPI001CC449E1|nr:thiamine-phosphate kinase [Geobacter sp. AOG1]GFE57268.1 thiamine-monophosphate kinase [Geobacter sp. AOG1]
MKLEELGEFGFIDRLAGQVKARPGVMLGIGDDAAILAPTASKVTLATSDMLVEGIHFDLALTDPFTLGRKSLAVNLSDLAAMGAQPRHALLSLAIPPALPVEFLDEFTRGFLALADEFQVALVGGDTCASRGGLVISVTALGEQCPDLVVRRSTACAGDLVLVTGSLGDSALGLEFLRQDIRSGRAVERHLDPLPRVAAGLRLAEACLATAMIDVSDGLLADLGHILDLSGVGARLDLARLPLSEECRHHVSVDRKDPFALPLAGGEDYELLFTALPEREALVRSELADCGVPVTVIGEITADRGLSLTDPAGNPYHPERQGYNHFGTIRNTGPQPAS